MLNTLRNILSPIFWLVITPIYLGAAFAFGLLQGFIPGSWSPPLFCASAIAFFFMVRWIRSSTPQQKPVKAVRRRLYVPEIWRASFEKALCRQKRLHCKARLATSSRH